MNIYLNAKRYEVSDDTAMLIDLVNALGIAQQNIAIAINQSVISRSNWPTQPLNVDDRIDIVQAIGGG